MFWFKLSIVIKMYDDLCHIHILVVMNNNANHEKV